MTTHPTLVLLPGLDGTGELFEPLLKVIPRPWPRRVVSYPADRVLSYAELGTVLEGQLADVAEMVIVAESFSGPLAVRYAAAHPGRVRALVLCASFIRSPAPRWLGWFVRPVLFSLPISNFLLKRLMLGGDATDCLVRGVKEAIRKVSSSVLAGRVREILRVDCSADLRRSPAPVLYLGASQDAIVKWSSREAIQAVRADVEVREVEGPHLVLQRAPEAAWAEIEKFLRGCSGRTRS